MTHVDKIARHLYLLRTARGLSQCEVARRLGYAFPKRARTRIRRAELGLHELSLSTLIRFARVYDVTLSSIVAVADDLPEAAE